MSMNHRGLNTCGGAELTGINLNAGVTEPIKCIANQRSWSGEELQKDRPTTWARAFYVMSYAYDEGKAIGNRSKNVAKRIERFQKYVEKHKLGTVTIAPDNPNPVHNSRTILRSCIYTPDHDALWKHIIKKKLYRVSRRNRDDYWGEL